jgi:HPt (histidine-containing phosphotransfer) domain-containing protein
LQLTMPNEPSVTIAAPPAWGVLDAAAVARLQELDPDGSAGLLTRVLATYTQSLQRLLGQLRAARQEADSQAQHHVVHTLKSSSASVGALKLAALCADVERRLRDDLLGGLGALLDDLTAEGARVLAALREV